jgi:DNA-binding transcriptional ArsR family regulator
MEDFIKALKALSDENRIKILKLLTSYDLCVRALSKKIGISEAAISQHLKILRDAGIVIGEKRGYFTHYRVEKTALSDVSKYIENLSS